MFTKTDIEKYFTAEKQGGLLFIFMGIACIAAALIFFFFLKTNFYKGAAIPLILIGLLMIGVGYTVYKRSDDDRKRNVYAYDMNSSDLKDKELPRMHAVMKNFVTFRYTEIFLLLVGIGMYVYFIKEYKNDFWRGFGFALALMALIALVADYFAESRARIYTKGIDSFVNKK